MQPKPNRVQTAMEVAYDLTRKNITGGNLEQGMASRWFPFLATLFFYIWFSNVIGFVPLPTNTQNEIHIFGLAVPTFAIYAATANISIPLALTLVVWISYNVEGIRATGFVGSFTSWHAPLRPASQAGRAGESLRIQDGVLHRLLSRLPPRGPPRPSVRAPAPARRSRWAAARLRAG